MEIARCRNTSSELQYAIVDQQPTFRYGIITALAKLGKFHCVAHGRSTNDALALTRSNKDLKVLIIDLCLSDTRNLKLSRQILAERPDLSIIILTTSQTREDVYRAYKSGLSAYLLKDSEIKDIADTVLRVASGDRLFSSELLQKVARRQAMQELTQREHDVLFRLAAGRSNKEIALDLNIGSESVKTHLKSIFNKIDVFDRTQAVLEATRIGLLPTQHSSASN